MRTGEKEEIPPLQYRDCMGASPLQYWTLCKGTSLVKTKMAAVCLRSFPPLNPRASAALNGTGFYVGVDLCGRQIGNAYDDAHAIAVVVNSWRIYALGLQ